MAKEPHGQHRPKWLILGATGRVGRLLEPHWGPGAVIIPQGRIVRPGMLVWSPLAGPWVLLAHMARHGGFDGMVMLSGVVRGTAAELAVNAALARACLAAARAAGIPRVLLASSAAVYGGAGDHPHAEGDTPRPDTPYGQAKLAMEAEAGPFRDKGLDVACLRIGNVAGADALLGPALAAQAPGAPDRRQGRVTPCAGPGPETTDGGVMDAARAHEDDRRPEISGERGSGVTEAARSHEDHPTPLRIDRFADGRGPLRSYIGGATLARALVGLMRHPGPLPPVLNVAAPVPVRMEDLATAAGRAWRWTPAPARAVQTHTLDCGLLATLVTLLPEDSDPWQMLRPPATAGRAA